MITVTVSPDHEISLPPEICERLGIKPGDTLLVAPTETGMTLIPMRHPRELRGFLSGIDLDFEREPDRL